MYFIPCVVMVWQRRYQGGLDYIFYERNRMSVRREIPLPSEEELYGWIPNERFPSDHMSVSILPWLLFPSVTSLHLQHVVLTTKNKSACTESPPLLRGRQITRTGSVCQRTCQDRAEWISDTYNLVLCWFVVAQ